MKKPFCIWLSPMDRAALENWVADRNTPQKVVWRAQIVLLAADGAGTMAIVRAVGKAKRAVGRWQERYLEQGIGGLRRDATRPSRKPPLAPAVIERVVDMTVHEKPPAATHWSVRTLAKAVGISHTSVQRIWKAHELKPHLVKIFKLSNDKRFIEKVQDVVGLYLDPPDKALVLSVDEKSQIQALDRTQPGLPIKKGRTGTMTRLQTQWDDHAVCRPQRRHRPRHRAMHEAAPPSGMAQVSAPHGRPRRCHTSTCISSLTITQRTSIPRSRPGSNGIPAFICTSHRHRVPGSTKSSASSAASPKSVAELEIAIQKYLGHHNLDPKPFVWTASATAILKKIARGRQALESVH